MARILMEIGPVSQAALQTFKRCLKYIFFYVPNWYFLVNALRGRDLRALSIGARNEPSDLTKLLIRVSIQDVEGL